MHYTCHVYKGVLSVYTMYPVQHTLFSKELNTNSYCSVHDEPLEYHVLFILFRRQRLNVKSFFIFSWTEEKLTRGNIIFPHALCKIRRWLPIEIISPTDLPIAWYLQYRRVPSRIARQRQPWPCTFSKGERAITWVLSTIQGCVSVCYEPMTINV